MSKKAKPKPASEQCMWYIVVFCGLLFLGSIVPVVPWRYAKMDAAMGNRFVMQRYYSLLGPTDAFGARTGWLTLGRKIQRKVEEFCRPNPMNMLMGTVTTMMGAGGAAMGCVSWEQCKTHIKSRYYQYQSVGIMGIVSMVMILGSALLCVGIIMCWNFEPDDDGKEKKKKKKKSDGGICDLSPKGKTMTCAIVSWFFSLCGTLGFVVMSDMMFQEFKRTAHYPYAASHAGAYMAGFACFIMFWVMLFFINRVTPFCKKKEDDGEGEAMAAGYEQYGGAPGNPYAAGGGYGGAPPGAYGGGGGGWEGGYGGAGGGYGGGGGAW